MLKILWARIQQYVNWKFLEVQAGFRKGRGTSDQIAHIHWIMEKAREFHKNIYFCFTDYTNVFDCVCQNKLWKNLKEMGIPDHPNCLLRNMYLGQRARVRTWHEPMDWFQIGKEVHKGVHCQPADLTYMQSTAWEMLGWMNCKLESRLQGETSTTSGMQITPP